MRYCAAEALRQDLFDEVRDSCLETPAEQKIKLEIDLDDAFDYEKGENTKFGLKES